MLTLSNEITLCDNSSGIHQRNDLDSDPGFKIISDRNRNHFNSPKMISAKNS